jgi:iron complex transport system substrate-binding protein
MRYKIAILLVLFSLMISASAGDYVLRIFGNANLDSDIDEQDLAYLQGIIDGKKKPTDLADADYNGKIDKSDIYPVEQIINGTQTEITITILLRIIE